MNLVPCVGFRAVYTIKEVAGYLGMTINQVRQHERAGRLKKAGRGLYPFAQSDVNQFLTKLNNGGFTSNRGKRKTA